MNSFVEDASASEKESTMQRHMLLGEEIKEAVSNGKYSVYTKLELPDSDIKALEEKGYRVVNIHGEDPRIRITWDRSTD